jgi:hypothetical protein
VLRYGRNIPPRTRSSLFRRDRKRGITQAEIERAIRAAQATNPNLIVTVDPIAATIKIMSGASPAPSSPPSSKVSSEPVEMSEAEKLL